MMDRRAFFGGLGLGLLGTTIAARAQQPQRVARIGFLGMQSETNLKPRVEALRAGLRELGYVEGVHVLFEYRWADGNYDRLPELAAELVRLKVDVIVTHATPGTRAARRATTTIPIVMAVSGDAVATGLIASLHKPGGNITGSTFFNPELCAKRLDILKEALPRATRVALLLNPDNPGNVANLEAIELAAKSLKLGLSRFETRQPDEFESAFSAMGMKGVDAVALIDDPMLIANVAAISRLASERRLPSIGFLELPETGGLIGYGVNFSDTFHRAAYFVDRILRGAHPAELPVERATKFLMVINSGAAKALGLAIPHLVLLRADRVI